MTEHASDGFGTQKLPCARAAIECSTINKVIKLLPQEYLASIRPSFLKLANHATRFQEIQCLLGRLQKSIDTKTLLPYLRSCKLPTIQFSKEASNSVHVQTAVAKMKNLHETYLGEVTSSIKDAKTLEASYYGDLITPSVYVPAITQIVQEVFDMFTEKCRVPTVSTDGSGNLQFSKDSVIPPHVVARHNELLHELPVLGLQIVTLARAKVNAKQQRNDKKKVIKRVTDAEAGTLGMNKASINKMVQNAV
ncbi:hypothetical protein BDN67DRAFT_1016312 [Paxillus ammoniavirescens]|nr:hypothetical protein BDN67DRAFT_1016312 [Paxillus ammoniavirescens]